MRWWSPLTAPVVVELALMLPLVPSSTTTLGSVDTTFGDNGFATVSLGTWAGAVAVQPDGEIVSAGEATEDGHNVIVSTRMTASGSLDPSYGTGGIATVSINGGAGVESGAAIALQPDGKIVIAGCGPDTGAGPLAFAAVRLNTDGTLTPRSVKAGS
jgi:uncharacterized delta-60 repeat protein